MSINANANGDDETLEKKWQQVSDALVLRAEAMPAEGSSGGRPWDLLHWSLLSPLRPGGSGMRSYPRRAWIYIPHLLAANCIRYAAVPTG